MAIAPPTSRSCARRLRVVGQGFLLPEEVDALVSEAGGLYDRIMARDPADPSCRYLFGR